MQEKKCGMQGDPGVAGIWVHCWLEYGLWANQLTSLWVAYEPPWRISEILREGTP